MDELTFTAYHEAGHAVAAERMNLHCGDITIVPNPKTGTLGTASSEDESADGSTNEQQIIVVLAGSAAEMRLDPKSSPGSQSDEEKAKELLSFFPPGSEERLRNRTLDLMNENWEQVNAIATALLEDGTLKQEEWSLIISAVDEGQDWRALLAELRQRL